MKCRPRKTTLLKLGVFVLLGAVVNVAVVLLFVLTTPIDQNLFPRSVAHAKWTVYSAPGASGVWNGGHIACGVSRTDLLGVTFIGVRFYTVPLPMYREGDVAELDPGWCKIHQLPRLDSITADREFSAFRSIVGLGWPCRSFWSNEAEADPELDSPEWHSNAGKYFWSDTWESRHVVPLSPIWPGFATNTIFYAAILWLLWIAPGKIRWFVRVRRGRCPACAYFIAPDTCANGLCSECGARLPWMKTQSETTSHA